MSDLLGLADAGDSSAVAVTGKAPKGERRDLFDWIDAIWNKSQPQGNVPQTQDGAFLPHAWLAADPDCAQLARELQHEVRDANLIFKVWQGYMPAGKRAPRWLEYVKKKKPPDAEKIVQRMMDVLAVRRDVAEQMYDLLDRAGKLRELHAHFGLKPKKGAA